MKKIGVALTHSLLLLSLWLVHGLAPARATVLVDSQLATAYTIPVAAGNPQNIVAQAPRKVWFTLPGKSAIGSLVVTDTTNFAFAIYQTTPNGTPYDLVYDPGAGAIWFTEKTANTIGKLTIATKAVVTYTIPTANSAPTGIDIAPNGHIWYVGQNSNRFGRFVPGPNTFTETLYTTAGAQFIDIAVSTNDEIWASSPALNRLVRFRPSIGQFVTAPVNDILQPPWPPQGMDMGQPGQPWVAAPTKNLVGFLSPGTLTNWFWYPLPGPATADPTALIYRSVGGQQKVWYVKTNANRAGELVAKTSGEKISVREIGLPAGANPAGIVVDNNLHVWITAPGTNQIIEWRPPYFHTNHLPYVAR